MPAAVAALFHGTGLVLPTGPGRDVVQILLVSLLYGAVAYVPLALWATWWIGGRNEGNIRWLMHRAPVLMAAGYVPCVALAKILRLTPGIVRP